jgi:hypothetical protein
MLQVFTALAAVNRRQFKQDSQTSGIDRQNSK